VNQVASAVNRTTLTSRVPWGDLRSGQPLTVYRICLGLAFLSLIFCFGTTRRSLEYKSHELISVLALAILLCLMVGRTLLFKSAIISIAAFIWLMVTISCGVFFFAFPSSLNDDGSECPAEEYVILKDQATGLIDRMWCTRLFGAAVQRNGTTIAAMPTFIPWSFGKGREASFLWGPHVGWLCVFASSIFAGVVLVLVIVARNKGDLIDNYEELRIYKKQRNYTDNKPRENFFIEKMRELRGIKKPDASQSPVEENQGTPTQVLARYFRRDL